eukprot:2451648-Amphidinium_carterae.1
MLLRPSNGKIGDKRLRNRQLNRLPHRGADRVDALARRVSQLEEKQDTVATKVSNIDDKVESLGTSMASQFGQVMSQLALMYAAQQGGPAPSQPSTASSAKAKRTQHDLRRTARPGNQLWDTVALPGRTEFVAPAFAGNAGGVSEPLPFFMRFALLLAKSVLTVLPVETRASAYMFFSGVPGSDNVFGTWFILFAVTEYSLHIGRVLWARVLVLHGFSCVTLVFGKITAHLRYQAVTCFRKLIWVLVWYQGVHRVAILEQWFSHVTRHRVKVSFSALSHVTYAWSSRNSQYSSASCMRWISTFTCLRVMESFIASGGVSFAWMFAKCHYCRALVNSLPFTPDHCVCHVVHHAGVLRLLFTLGGVQGSNATACALSVCFTAWCPQRVCCRPTEGLANYSTVGCIQKVSRHRVQIACAVRATAFVCVICFQEQCHSPHASVSNVLTSCVCLVQWHCRARNAACFQKAPSGFLTRAVARDVCVNAFAVGGHCPDARACATTVQRVSCSQCVSACAVCRSSHDCACDLLCSWVCFVKCKSHARSDQRVSCCQRDCGGAVQRSSYASTYVLLTLRVCVMTCQLHAHNVDCLQKVLGAIHDLACNESWCFATRHCALLLPVPSQRDHVSHRAVRVPTSASRPQRVACDSVADSHGSRAACNKQWVFGRIPLGAPTVAWCIQLIDCCCSQCDAASLTVCAPDIDCDEPWCFVTRWCIHVPLVTSWRDHDSCRAVCVCSSAWCHHRVACSHGSCAADYEQWVCGRIPSGVHRRVIGLAQSLRSRAHLCSHSRLCTRSPCSVCRVLLASSVSHSVVLIGLIARSQHQHVRVHLPCHLCAVFHSLSYVAIWTRCRVHIPCDIMSHTTANEGAAPGRDPAPAASAADFADALLMCAHGTRPPMDDHERARPRWAGICWIAAIKSASGPGPASECRVDQIIVCCLESAPPLPGMRTKRAPVPLPQSNFSPSSWGRRARAVHRPAAAAATCR